MNAVLMRLGRRALLPLVAGACFSDRSESTAPPTGAECTFPISGGIIGTTQALVAIQGFAFQPVEIRVRQGSRVTWLNCEPAGTPAHTSTSDNGVWSSPTLEPGAQFSRVFDQVGRFAFHCEPHPFMTATVVVE